MNNKTIPLAASTAIGFGHALDHIIREILLENPVYGPVLMSKYDINDGFYHIDLNTEDIPKLGVTFPLLRQVPSLSWHSR